MRKTHNRVPEIRGLETAAPFVEGGVFLERAFFTRWFLLIESKD